MLAHVNKVLGKYWNAEDGRPWKAGMLMVAPAVEGIDLFKIAGRSISGWIPSLKTGTTVRQLE
jgi:hypothetical protein